MKSSRFRRSADELCAFLGLHTRSFSLSLSLSLSTKNRRAAARALEWYGPLRDAANVVRPTARARGKNGSLQHSLATGAQRTIWRATFFSARARARARESARFLSFCSFCRGRGEDSRARRTRHELRAPAAAKRASLQFLLHFFLLLFQKARPRPRLPRARETPSSFRDAGPRQRVTVLA